VTITALAIGNANCPNGGTQFSVGSTVSYACNGGQRTECPAGFTRMGAQSTLCIETTDHALFTFTGAAAHCNSIGAHLMTSSEARAALATGIVLTNGLTQDWLADQVGDDQALFVNSVADPENLDGVRATTVASWARCAVRIE
jgi:hypothetical protein